MLYYLSPKTFLVRLDGAIYGLCPNEPLNADQFIRDEIEEKPRRPLMGDICPAVAARNFEQQGQRPDGGSAGPQAIALAPLTPCFSLLRLILNICFYLISSLQFSTTVYLVSGGFVFIKVMPSETL